MKHIHTYFYCLCLLQEGMKAVFTILLLYFSSIFFPNRASFTLGFRAVKSTLSNI